MAIESQIEILKKGWRSWNEWLYSDDNIDLAIDLSKTDLRGAQLYKTDLSTANLSYSNLSHANLSGADLAHANLSFCDLSYSQLTGAYFNGADLSNANLNNVNGPAYFYGANLSNSILSEAYLYGSNFTKANLSNADLRGAVLEGVVFVDTILANSDLTGCSVYGISAWDILLNETKQQDLIITPNGKPVITVDNLEVAQFIYLLLNNEKIRDVIDTISCKLVLILGRFTPDRKIILDTIREELRQRNYLPVLFDFQIPSYRDITETVSTLAHMARFVIADITEAKSIPQELQSIVPNLPSVPVQPLLQRAKNEYSMFEHFKRYPWVLPIQHYDGHGDLLSLFENKVFPIIEKRLRGLKRI